MSDPREAVARRASSDAAMADDARGALRDVLEQRARPELAPGLDPLGRALVVAGAAVGIGVSEHRSSEIVRRPEPDVRAAAARLRIPVREVALERGWWRERGFPYVITPAGRDPVAVLPARGGYRLAGSEGDAPKVTAREAAALGERAWVVTPRLPDGHASARDLLRVALTGSGRADLGLIALAGLVLTLLGLVLPGVTAWVVSSLIPQAEEGALGSPAAALAGAAVATLAWTVLQGLTLLRVAGDADARVMAAVLDRVFHLPATFFRTRSSGQLTRETLALDQIRQMVSSSVVAALGAGALAIGSFAMILVTAPELGFAPAAVVVVGTGVAVWHARRGVGALRDMTIQRAHLNGVLMGLLNGISKLRVAGAEQRMAAVWATGYARQQSAQRRSANAAASIAILFACLSVAATLALILGAEAIEREIAIEKFVAISAAIGQLIAAMTLMVPALTQMLGVRPLYDIARPILETPIEIAEHAIDPGALRGEVELAGVRFSYGPDQPPALDDISLRAAEGELVAIVGPSGAGKSTIVRLLLGFERPERGSVLYDGRDLATIDADAVRRQIGVVIQSAQLTTGSILQNIVGVLPFTEDDAWRAAERAGVAEDIRAMPMGMRTFVTDGGSGFSGGQRQRLVIARALLRDPRVLIFDEATSALDNETQATVTASLAEFGATRIVIAHRLSTIRAADRIYVVEAGRVVESGTYDELLAAGGLFTRLARRQLVDPS